jgi:hypothetical protein
MVELGLEIIAAGELGVRLDGFERARRQRPAVVPDQYNGLQLGHHAGDACKARMQRRLRLSDLVVRHAANNLVNFGEGAVDGLKDLERLFLHDIERTIDALIGDGVDFAVIIPTRIGE